MVAVWLLPLAPFPSLRHPPSARPSVCVRARVRVRGEWRRRVLMCGLSSVEHVRAGAHAGILTSQREHAFIRLYG